ncbi:neutral zinc metallopeptidase [Streptosporangium sp. NPDC000239]|uniref:Neutral zinc metallopeptidase n=1 Tax=Streptosporangium jomthongense TaxID=1193683 RepID=A0ABV8EW57_9ACTN
MRPRRSSPLAFGVFGVLALTFAVVVVIAGLVKGNETGVPAGPETGPVATGGGRSMPSGGTEVAPPEVKPPSPIKLGDENGAGGTAITLASAQSGTSFDLRNMRRSDTTARLKRNPLYGAGVMGSVACRAPRPSTQPAAMYSYLNAVTGCLDRAWAGKFAQARATFLAPRRVYWNRPGRGPCGTYPSSGAAAYYCPSNRGMYIGLTHVIRQSGDVDPAENHVPYLAVLAHEYGHHVQSMAGIGGAWWWEVANRSKSAQDAHSRRAELQAQCLSGIFVRAVRTPLAVTADRWQSLLRTDYGRGDDQNGLGKRDHGNGDHYAGWLNQGWKYSRLAYCNTWSVPASYVS